MKKDKITYIPIGILTGVTLLSGAALAEVGAFATTINANCTTSNGVQTCTTEQVGTEGQPGYQAAKPVTATVSVIPSACTLTGTAYNLNNLELSNGQTWYSANSQISENVANPGYKDPTIYNMTATCNDAKGVWVNAIGYSPATAGGAASDGNTALIGGSGSIATGTTINGSTSTWAFRVALSGNPLPSANFNAAVQSPYNDYAEVPSSSTPIVKVTPHGTSSVASVSVGFYTDYRIYVSGTQPAGTYVGGVKYTVVHPN